MEIVPFVTKILGVLSLLVFTLYIYKSIYVYRRPERPGKEVIYSIKSVAWILVSVSFLVFTSLPGPQAHTLIFTSWAAIILIELGYNIIYAVNIARDLKKWIQK